MPLRSGSAWVYQEVSYVGFGENKLWVVGVFFKFLAQAPDNSIVAVSIRQIAHEVLTSIEQALPDLHVEAA